MIAHYVFCFHLFLACNANTWQMVFACIKYILFAYFRHVFQYIFFRNECKIGRRKNTKWAREAETGVWRQWEDNHLCFYSHSLFFFYYFNSFYFELDTDIRCWIRFKCERTTQSDMMNECVCCWCYTHRKMKKKYRNQRKWTNSVRISAHTHIHSHTATYSISIWDQEWCRFKCIFCDMLHIFSAWYCFHFYRYTYFSLSLSLSFALEMETSIRMGMGVYGKPIYGLQSLKQLDAIHIFTHIYKMIMIKVKETSVTFANELWGRKLASPDSSNG